MRFVVMAPLSPFAGQRDFADGHCVFERLDCWTDLQRRGERRHHCLLRLEAGAGDERYHNFVRPDVSILDEPAQPGNDDPSRRLREDSLRLRKQFDPIDDFLVGDGGGRAARLLERLEGIVAVRRVADGKRFRDGVRLLGTDGEAPALPGVVYGRAAEGLDTAHAGGVPVDEAKPGELLDPLVYLREEGTAGQRHDTVVRRTPAQLLADFVAERLAALGVVGPHVDVYERPGILIAELAAEAVDIVVAALHGDERRAIDSRTHDLPLLQVGRDEDAGLHAGARGVGGDAVGEVAGGGAGQGIELELAGYAAGDGDDAVLERPRGVLAIVLDVQVVEPEDAGQVIGP